MRGIIGGLGYRYFTISVPDIYGLMTQLEAKGIKPTLSITEARPGVTIAMVTDPTATRLSFCRTPAEMSLPAAVAAIKVQSSGAQVS